MADRFPPDEPAFPGLNTSSESEIQPAAPEQPRVPPTTRLYYFFFRAIDSISDDEEDERREQILALHVNPIIQDFCHHLQLVSDDIANGSLTIRQFLRDHLLDPSTASNRRNGGFGLNPDDPLDIDEILRPIGGRRAVELRRFIDAYRMCVLNYFARTVEGIETPPHNYPVDEARLLIDEMLQEDSDTESYLREREAELLENLPLRINGDNQDSRNDPFPGGGGDGCNGHVGGGGYDDNAVSTAAPENGHH